MLALDEVALLSSAQCPNKASLLSSGHPRPLKPTLGLDIILSKLFDSGPQLLHLPSLLSSLIPVPSLPSLIARKLGIPFSTYAA